uniref:NLR family pyrin domain containing 13 n=1 Tax=Catagonus wagneri TaxID=51154 RepID=A0A8C3W6J4_9CETA
PPAPVLNCPEGALLLISCLEGLDQYQLEEFKLCLQSPQLMTENLQKIPWTNLKAVDPSNLFCLLSEYLSVPQIWDVTLCIFESMKLTSLCEEIRTEMNGEWNAAWNSWEQGNFFSPSISLSYPHCLVSESARALGLRDPGQEEPQVPEEETAHRRRYRERMKDKILVLWDNIPWPEGHLYLRNVTEQEHEELRSLLCPNGTGAQPQTVILGGRAGVGKTILAMKVMLHWAEGALFQHRFSYVFYISCHKLQRMKDTTFAGLLSQDWPDPQIPLHEFINHSERLLFIIDGFVKSAASSTTENSTPCTDWYTPLPVDRIVLHLLKKELAPQATLLITTRDTQVAYLKKLLPNPCFILVSGFTEEDRAEYFIRFFGDQDKANKILQWLRKNETLFYCCSAPLVCWTVCSSLKWQMARNPSFEVSAQTTTSIYAYFFSRLLTTAEVNVSDRSWPEQWRALCSLAAEGMWSSDSVFANEVLERCHLEASLIDSLLRLNILQKVVDCEGCVTFTHQSFQMFFGAMFYVLRGTKGSIGELPKCEELKVLMNDAFADANSYWHQMALFLFGLLKRDLARELEDTLRCEMSPRATHTLLEWTEELGKYDPAHLRFEFLQFFQCLRETRDENMVKQALSCLREADVDIEKNEALHASSSCLKHCQKLTKLRLSIHSPIPQVEFSSDAETLGTVNFKMRQWQDICSVFCNGNMSELDLSNSKLNTLYMKKLCFELRNPRCKLQKLTCRSVSPVRVLKELVLVLHCNHSLTHLDLSSNNLGITVSTIIFRTLRHPACSLKYLLEKCNLPVASCQDLALLLISTHRMTHLCLGFNQIQDAGVKLLCASLTHAKCLLERLVLWFCQLGAASCGYLSNALLQNKRLTHLNLRKNNLGDEGVKLLCEPLRCADCRLQDLNLSDCSFSVEGCRELADALKHNRSVTVLDIGENNVRDDGVKELCEALKHLNCALKTLGLEKCSLTRNCCQHICSVLRKNRSLVHLNLLGNDLGPDGVNKLWTSLKKSTCRLQKLG